MDLDLYNESCDFICNAISKAHVKLFERSFCLGNITQYSLSKRPDFDIFATDIAPNMIELAKINNSTARFEVMGSRNKRKLVMARRRLEAFVVIVWV